jgi:hypothetical protein
MSTPSTHAQERPEAPASATAAKPEQARLGVEQVWAALDKASFAVLSFVAPDGEPRSSGVVYAVARRRMYVVTAPDSLKARQLYDASTVSVTVPVRRGGLLSLVAPIPPATITFRARTTVHRAGSVDPASISKKLARMLPAQRKAGAVLELEPVGTFVTYGIGVSLREMMDPSLSLARVPIASQDSRQ